MQRVANYYNYADFVSPAHDLAAKEVNVRRSNRQTDSHDPWRYFQSSFNPFYDESMVWRNSVFTPIQGRNEYKRPRHKNMGTGKGPSFTTDGTVNDIYESIGSQRDTEMVTGKPAVEKFDDGFYRIRKRVR